MWEKYEINVKLRYKKQNPWTNTLKITHHTNLSIRK